MVKLLNGLVKLFLFLLSWQTIWLYREVFVGGVKMEYGTLGFYATEILLWVIVIVFVCWFWKERKLRNFEIKKFSLTRDRIFVFSLLLFTFYFLLSTFWSTDRSLALQQGVRVMEAILLFLIIIIGPLNKEKLIRWFIYGAILPSILGIWQFLSQATFVSTWLGLAIHPAWQAGTSVIASETIGRWLRAYGTFSHPNVFGGYLVVVIVLWLSLRGGARATAKQSLGNLEKIKIINLSGIASSADANRLSRNDMFIYSLFLTALFFTFSRSAWLALLIGLGVLCWRNLSQPSPYSLRRELGPNGGGKACLPARQGWGLFLVMPVVLFLIFSFIYFPLIQTRTNNSTISETRSITERTTGYSEAWKMIKQNPILGVGAGNYTIALWRMDKWRPVWELQPVHNVPLLLLVELGFVGLLLVLLIIWSFFRLKTYDLSLMSYILCLIPLLLFDHYLYTSYAGLMLISVFLGILLKSDAQSLPS